MQAATCLATAYLSDSLQRLSSMYGSLTTISMLSLSTPCAASTSAIPVSGFFVAMLVPDLSASYTSTIHISGFSTIMPMPSLSVSFTSAIPVSRSLTTMLVPN